MNMINNCPEMLKFFKAATSKPCSLILRWARKFSYSFLGVKENKTCMHRRHLPHRYSVAKIAIFFVMLLRG